MFVLLVASCGGGGDSSSAGGISYTGKTSQVVVTKTNAQPLSQDPLTSSNTGSSTGNILGVVTQSDTPTKRRAFSSVISHALVDASKQIKITPGTFLPGVTQTVTDALPCVSGNGSISVTGDDVTGVVSGSLTMNQCLSSGSTLSGSISFSGVYDFASDTISQIQMTFNNLSINDNTDDYTLSGEVDFDSLSLSSSSTNILMNILLKDNKTNEVVKLENFRVSATDLITETKEILTGRLYDPTYGYGDVRTITPLLTRNTDDWPYSGQLTFTGNHSSLRATAISNTQYILEVDADGDGIYETVTTESW
jgi:hypothetical protein